MFLFTQLALLWGLLSKLVISLEMAEPLAETGSRFQDEALCGDVLGWLRGWSTCCTTKSLLVSRWDGVKVEWKADI